MSNPAWLQGQLGLRPQVKRIWLECQQVSEATRLQLFSSRRRNSSFSFQPSQISASIKPFSNIYNHPRPFELDHGRQPKRSPLALSQPIQILPSDFTTDETSQSQLVRDLGALAWHFKSTPQSRRPGDVYQAARALAQQLLPHVTHLSTPDLAHCCWAFAQFPGIARNSTAVTSFITAVQQHLLTLFAPPAPLTPHALDMSYSARFDDDAARHPQRPQTLSTQTGPYDPGYPKESDSTSSRANRSKSSGSSHADINSRSGSSRTAAPTTHATHQASSRHPHYCFRLSVMAPRDLSKLTWALAKLGIGAAGASSSLTSSSSKSLSSSSSSQSKWDEDDEEPTRRTTGTDAMTGVVVVENLAESGDTDVCSTPGKVVRQQYRELQDRWWGEVGDVAAAAITAAEMSPQGISNSMWAFATVRRNHEGLLRAAAGSIAGGSRTKFKPLGIANLIWAFATLRFYHPYDDEDGGSNPHGPCQDLYDQTLPPLDPNLYGAVDRAVSADGTIDADGTTNGDGTTAGEWYGTQRSGRHRQQHLMGTAAGAHRQRHQVNDASTDLYNQLYGTLARLGLRALPDMSLQQLANCAWGVVVSGQHRRHHDCEKLVGAVRARATEVLMSASGTIYLDPQALSTLSWVFATAAPRPRHPAVVGFLDAVVAATLAAPSGLKSYGDQDLAMLLTAHTRAARFSAPLVHAVVRAPNMQPQALTEICYNLAVTNFYNEPLYDAVAATAVRRLPVFGPSLGCRLVWCFARARHYRPKLLNCFSEYIRPRLPACGPQDLASLAASLAHLHHPDTQLFNALTREVVTRIHIHTRRLDRPSDADADSYGSESTRANVDVNSPTTMTTTVPANTTNSNDRKPRKSTATTAPSSSPSPPDLPVRALVHLLWGFTMMSHVDEELLVGMLVELGALDLRELPVPAVMQLFQVQVMLQDLYGGIIEPPRVLSPKQMKVAAATWSRTCRTAASPSRLQGQVMAALTRLGCRPECEGSTDDGLFSMDIALEWEGRSVALEVDGPTHFTQSRPYRALGRTLAKRRCLELRGWQVVSVPGHEWRALGGSAEAEERYLRRALEGVQWRAHVLEGAG